MQESLSKTQNTQENEKLILVIKSRLLDLNKEIKNMSEDEIKTEKSYKILDMVAEILDFNEQYQQGLGLKILTPEQMFSRLPISLVQLKVRNNFEKLKNEIRQLLYSLFR